MIHGAERLCLSVCACVFVRETEEDPCVWGGEIHGAKRLCFCLRVCVHGAFYDRVR